MLFCCLRWCKTLKWIDVCIVPGGLLSDINGIRWRYTTQMVLISEQLSSCLMFLFLLFWPNCYNVNHPDILEAWMKFLPSLSNLLLFVVAFISILDISYYSTGNSVVSKFSDSSNISNTSEANATGPWKEIKLVLLMSPKYMSREKDMNPK